MNPRVRLPRRTTEIRVELTPLIDVVFLLLTFFVFSIVLMVRADTMDVSLPELVGGERATPGGTVSVTVTLDGAIRVNGEPTDLESLVTAARAALETDPDARLILAIDEGAPAGALIRVAGELAQNGMGDFSVIGRPADENPGGPTGVSDTAGDARNDVP
jgi:biopolymer transport protein ExbD